MKTIFTAILLASAFATNGAQVEFKCTSNEFDFTNTFYAQGSISLEEPGDQHVYSRAQFDLILKKKENGRVASVNIVDMKGFGETSFFEHQGGVIYQSLLRFKDPLSNLVSATAKIILSESQSLQSVVRDAETGISYKANCRLTE